MRLAGIVVAGALAGCVRTSSIACGDDLFCPEGTVCVHATETVTVCAAPDNGECRDLLDGELCGAAGRCYDHVCLPIACGDQLIDPGAMGIAREACDDGNTVSGDGCAADCRSDELCGTGALDPLEAEACDDGNPFAHDGCSLGCAFETPRWSRVDSRQPSRDDPSLVFDPVRGRVTMIGGSAVERETPEWGGLAWTSRTTQFAPPPRTGQAAAYDVARKNVVLFGGFAGGDLLDTWLLDATGWTLADPVSPGPGGRSHHAMAYDPVRKRIVMFGGTYGQLIVQVLDDTWEWDGSTWTQIVPPIKPSARTHHTMAFDPGRGKILLFGGQSEGSVLHGDTWEWNGTTWTRLDVAVSPSPRYAAAMTTYRGGLLLYGGTTAGGADKEVWRWQGSTWTLVGAGGAGSRSSAGMATDFLRDRAVLFGGLGSRSEVWEYDGTSFELAPIVTPSPTVNGAVAFDARRGRAVVVADGATFERIDEGWSSVTATTPPARSRHGLAYDTARDEVVMFGGDVGATPTAETWVLTATGASRAWVRRMPTRSPSARAGHGLAHDGARSRAVTFGGRAGAGTLDDTWEWDGSTWHDMSSVSRPPARSGHALAYDPIRGVTVLYGGADQNGGPLGDLWEWNGTAWAERSPVGPRPFARSETTLTWNPSRRRLTLVGGTGGPIGVLDDAWEWDGTSWTVVPTELRPPPTTRHVAMQTSDGSGLIRFGGLGASGPTDEVWRLRWTSTETDEQCAGRIDRDGDGFAGCEDPDCWARCTPLCGPGVTCAATAPRCGDGTADPRETCQLCPADVAACPTCGDLLCEGAETLASCPGDCTPP